MSPTTTEILNRALSLPVAERAALAHELLLSLDAENCDPADWAEAWAVEVERRADEIDNGTAKLIDWEEALDETRRLLAERRKS